MIPLNLWRDKQQNFYGCGVSQFTQFFDRIKHTNQILPRYYVECSEVEKVHLFKKNCCGLIKISWIICDGVNK